MNKKEYLEELSRLLRKLPKEDREDIISDYGEHFAIGLEKGRSEEEISRALG
jgi:Predicted membrane protein